MRELWKNWGGVKKPVIWTLMWKDPSIKKGMSFYSEYWSIVIGIRAFQQIEICDYSKLRLIVDYSRKMLIYIYFSDGKVYILTLPFFFRRIRNRKYMASDSDSESSDIDDPPIFTQEDLPSPPRSLVSGVSGEGATTFEGSALSSDATSSTPRS